MRAVSSSGRALVLQTRGDRFESDTVHMNTIEPKIHLLDFDKLIVEHGTLCQKAIAGDRAIALRDALNSEMDLKFNCDECLEVLTNEIFKEDI